MSNSWFHAQSASRKWGGEPEDYLAIEEFIDGTKKAFGDVRHRALLHNTFGVWLVQEVFGPTITVDKKTGGTKKVAVREIAEQHILEDLGFIPSPGDWLENMNIKTWMGGARQRTVGLEELIQKEAKV